MWWIKCQAKEYTAYNDVHSKNIRIQSPFAARNFLHRSKAKSLEKGNERARDGSLFAKFKHNAAIALFLLSNGSNNDSNDAPDVDWKFDGTNSQFTFGAGLWGSYVRA